MFKNFETLTVGWNRIISVCTQYSTGSVNIFRAMKIGNTVLPRCLKYEKTLD